MSDYDIIVAGAGLAGGLPAAAYLQKAGFKVGLIERGVDTGKFYHSYELHPGVMFDHSPVNFSCISPAMLDLDLEGAGYVARLPSILHSVTDGNGNHMTFYPNLERNLSQLEVYSKRDAARFRTILQNLQPHWVRLLRILFYSPHPDRARYDEALQISADALDMSVEELVRTNGIQLLESLFESEQSRIFLIPLPALHLFGDLSVPGQGALAWLWALLLRACISPAGNQSLVRALERVFLQHGGDILRNTSVESFDVSNNRCEGVVVRTHHDDQTRSLRAREAVISNLGASLTLKMLGDTPLPESFDRQLKNWSMAKRVLAVHDFILPEPPQWTAAPANPDFARSPRIYLVWNTWHECVQWLENSLTEEATFHGDVEMTLMNNIYDHSATGKYALRIRHGTGPYSMELEEKRQPFTDRMLSSLTTRNPIPLQRAISHQMATPLDFWRANPAALHGNPVGGDFIEGQWMLDRCPYETPVEHLYMSNSVWPTAMSWLAPGYNAAGVIMDRLGRKRPSWWSHEPGEWFTRRVAQRRAGAAS
ncbi:phytoene desaturase family protein [Elongatibacter sediminis]|uniref:FAD-dependent oxidoreductase n=1 Tax=Elongatibacter sediminis TaxID=3119006 RepID=A0AAW9RI20_9GAMM